MLLQLLGQFVAGVVIFGKDDGGLYHLAAIGIRDGCDRTFQDRRVFHQGTLHFEGADPVTRTLDHIICPSDEPIIAILIPPGHIASVINIVVPYLICQLLIAVISIEHPNRPALIGINHNLSLVPHLAGATRLIQQINPVPGRWFPHRARFGFHPRIGSQCDGAFRLTVTFHQSHTGLLQKLLVYLRIKRLTGHYTVFQRTQIKFGKIFLDQETVDGRRRTKGSYLVFFDDLHQPFWNKFVIVVSHDGTAG